MVCLSGEWDETYFDIFVIKEPDKNIMIILTYYCLTGPDGKKEEIKIVNGDVIKFKYSFFSDHYRYEKKDNALRHDGGKKVSN